MKIIILAVLLNSSNWRAPQTIIENGFSSIAHCEAKLEGFKKLERFNQGYCKEVDFAE